MKLTAHCKLLFAICLLLVGINAVAANFVASTDRTSIVEGETFNLLLTLSDLKTSGSPDLSGLEKQFEILGEQQTEQISMVGGRNKRSIQWIITLLPKQNGKLNIPSIRLGPYQSQPVTINVLAATNANDTGPARNVFLESNATPKYPYVQSQVIYTVKLFFSVNLANAALSDPQASDAIVTRLGNDINYQVKRNERYYQVIERRYAIFPQKSGTLDIQPPTLTGIIQDMGPDNQLGSLFNVSGRPVRLQAPAVTINTRSKPANTQQNWWLPAQRITINEDWSSSPPSFRVGEPITRTITLQATGLTAAQLPQIISTKLDGFKLYPNQPELRTHTSGDNILGQRIEKIAMIPLHEGKLTLPRVTIHWWNTITNKPVTTTLPAKAVTVLPAVTRPATTNAANTIAALDTETDTANNNTFNPIKPRGFFAHLRQQQSIYWFSLSTIFAILWLFTIAAWWRLHKIVQARDAAAKQTRKQRLENLRSAQKRLEKYCRDDDAGNVKQTLLLLAKLRWPNQSTLTLGQMAKRIDSLVLREAIMNLDKHIYTQTEVPWDGKYFWKCWASQRRTPKAFGQRRQLPSLYPN